MRFRWLILAGLLTPAAATAQPALSLDGGYAAGARTTVTEGWTTLEFTVTNRTDVDRRALVLAFYDNRLDVQYGREVWVPARARITSWLPIGAAPEQKPTNAREIQLRLQDITDAKDELSLPAADQKGKPRPVRYRKRDLTTMLVLDPDPDDDLRPGVLPPAESLGQETFTMAQVFRSASNAPATVDHRLPDDLPGWAKAYDGIDQVILASRGIGRNPAGLAALRQWVEHGGKLWIMLDQVETDAVAAILGEAFDFHIAGRVGLTNFQVEEEQTAVVRSKPQAHEKPVDFVRVVLPEKENVPLRLGGWPVWFTRPVGRGKVLLTTLGPRAWYRPRTDKDSRSPYAEFPRLPVWQESLLEVANELAVQPAEGYPVAEIERMLTQDVGYSVVSRQTIALVFGGFLLAAVGLAALVRGRRRPEWLGWLGPLVAFGAGGLLVIAGEASRRAAPPTVAFVQIVDAVSGTDEAAVRGMLAVYRPDSGAADFAAADGGFFDLDMKGIEGQTRRMIFRDLDAWRWHNLALPAGVRVAPFQFTAKTPQPVVARARFTQNGLEGELVAEPFKNLADPIVTAHGKRRNLGVRLEADGKFSLAGADALPEGQYIAGTLLSDVQQRRQEVLRKLLKRPAIEPRDSRHFLHVWADATPAPFGLAEEPRITGTALLSVPLQIDRPAPSTRITVPGAFVPLREIINDRLAHATYQAKANADLHLRFQLPAAVLPLTLERARLSAKIDARGRRVILSSLVDGAAEEIYRGDNPLGPFEVEIADVRLLKLDKDGGLHMNLKIQSPPQTQPAGEWVIEYIELEVMGQTGPDGAKR